MSDFGDKLILALLLAALLVNCTQSRGHSNARESVNWKDPRKVASNGVTSFGLNFLNAIRDGARKNVAISPLSLHVLMDMLHLGAEDGSATQRDLARVLGYATLEKLGGHLAPHEQMLQSLANSSKSATKLTLANIILANDDLISLRPGFRQQVERYYTPVGFETFKPSSYQGQEVAQRVNDWVSNKTEKMMGKLFTASDFSSADLALVMLNVAHFKSEWSSPFDAKLTKDRTFYNGGHNKSSVRAPFMEQTRAFHLGDTDGFEILVMDFKDDAYGGQLNMAFLIPKERNGLDELLGRLSAKELRRVIDSAKRVFSKVSLPRFAFEWHIDARQTLERMGLGRIFSGSDLKRMFHSSENRYRVDRVSHKCKIVVDEKGAEAAAASAISVPLMAMFPPRKQIILDHPFFYVIFRRDSLMPLFMGRVDEI